MEIKIRNIELTETELVAVVDFKSAIGRWDYSVESQVSREFLDKVTEAAAQKYLELNLHKLLESLNNQQILNAVTLRVADKMTNLRS